jgi:WD40 repeat protein/serine/threonine protein kinase
MAVVISHKYEVLDLLGQGGMGIVYKVRHTALDTIRALKALPRELMNQPEMVRRFSREARLMSQLFHPNIIRVLDIDRDETIPCHYFVMEYLQGQNLRQYLRDKGPLPLLEVLEIARQVAKALSYAHMHNPPVIHRDIKPSNIMVEDGSGRVVVTDFGIAKELDESDMTRSGVVLGTLNYCAPEQFRHEPLDGSADVYALGMVMYEAYEGKPFFADLAEHEVITRLLSQSEDHTPRFARPPPPAFASLVTRAIAKSRARRYRSVDAFLHDLEVCWAALDDAKTVTVSVPTLQELHAPVERPDDVADIEEQIRKLGEERRKRLASTAQTQARESRERAVKDGGGRWATAVFQQALGSEERGHALLRAQDYEGAQAAYQEAVAFFTRAGEDAKTAALVHQVEQARQDMATAKTEAERFGARERARTFYGRGLALQAQADELCNAQAYEKAKQLYTEASSIFEDARELAYRLGLKATAETARGEMQSAQEKAVRDGAETLAVAVLQEAAVTQRRAELALAHEEFTQARDLYASARQHYESAREQALAARAAREAELERLRQQAALARQRAQEVQSKAQREGAQARLPSEFAQAERLIEQGKEHEKRGESMEAARVYEQAAAKFAELHQEALRLVQLELQRQRHAALAAKQQTLNLQQIVEEEPLPRSVDELFRHAHEAKQKAEQAEAAERWNEATTEFTRASSFFTDLLVRMTEEVRQEVAASRLEAEGMDAPEKAAVLYKQGVTLEAQAISHWEAAAYQHARQGYREARAIFVQAREQAQQVNLKERAHHAREETAQMRETLQREGVDGLVPTFFRDAWDQEQQSDAALREENFALAAELYESARQKYESARQHALVERQRQRALAAQQQAQLKRAEAEAARVRLDHISYRQALEALRRGETALAAGYYEQAVSDYDQASEHCEQAIQQRELERRQQAEAARRQAQLTREKVATLGSQAAARWAEAQAEEEQAEVDYQAQRYDEAKTRYERARRAYEAAAEEAVYEQLRQEALQARRTAAASREQMRAFIPSNSERWLGIQTLETEAEEMWRSGKYREALTLYEQLCRQYERVQQEEQAEQRRRPALAAHQQAELAQREAETAEAQQHAMELFQKAREARQEGESKFAATHWEEAVECFSRASELFVQARYDARLTKARLAAEDARSQALAAQNDVAVEDGEALFPGRLEEARARLREAEEVFLRLEFGAARKKFLESVSLFSHIHRDALRVKQREQTEQARDKALRLRERLESLPGSHKRRAEQALFSGEQLFQQRQYVEARTCYEEVAALLAPLPSTGGATVAGNMRSASSRHVIFLAIAIISAAAIGLYLIWGGSAEKKSGLEESTRTPRTTRLSEERQLSLPDVSPDVSPQGQSETLGQGAEGVSRGADSRLTPSTVSPTNPVPEAPSVTQPPLLDHRLDLQAAEWHAAPESLHGRLFSQEKTPAQEETARSSTLPHTAQALPREKEEGSFVRPSGPFAKLSPLRRVLSSAVLELQAPISDASQAFLDDRLVRILPGGIIRETLPNLPIGDSTHRLLLVNAAAKAHEALLTLTYYPRWEMRQIKDGSNEVYFVAFSPDGRTLLTGSRDKTLKLWEVKDGRKLRIFVGHEDWVNGVAFSPDGKLVVSGSDDKTVRLWDVATGKLFRVLTGHAGVVHGVAFSPDGAKIVSASSDRALKLWETKTGAELLTLTGHANWIWTVAFSPDGKTVLSGSEDRNLKLWDAETGKEVRTFSGHRQGVSSAVFSPDGKTILSGSSDGVVKLWEVATGKLVHSFSRHEGRINSLAFSRDGRKVVSAGKDKTLKLWDGDTNQMLRTFVGHEASVIGAAFSPDGNLLASGGRDKTIRFWWGGPESILEAANGD